MILKILILVNFLTLSACAAQQPVATETAQAMMNRAWHSDQHTVWEIEWPASPTGGLLTVETWRLAHRYRFEILESTAPALIGQTLIFDGQNGWRYHRFEAGPVVGPVAPRLSPVSEAFAVIERLLATPPLAAEQLQTRHKHGPAQKISLTFANDEQLIFWLDRETNLPMRILFLMGGKVATLEARHFEPLLVPLPGLFEP